MNVGTLFFLREKFGQSATTIFWYDYKFRNNVNVKFSNYPTILSKISQNFFLILLKET